MSKIKIENKVVIITGASSGIGKALAYEFVKNNAKVSLAARRVERLEEVKKDIEKAGGECIIVKTDVTKEEDCKRLIEKTVEHYGTVDMLINNAGISMRALFIDLDLDVIRKVMDVNFWGTVYCTKYALPYLLKQKAMNCKFRCGIPCASG